MRPCASVSGTRCTRCVPDSNLKAENAPRPTMRLMTSLYPPCSPWLSREDLHLPAARLPHSARTCEQVAGEDGGLVAAGAGAHLQVDVAFVARILRQQQQGQIPLALLEQGRQTRGLPPGPSRALPRRHRPPVRAPPSAVLRDRRSRGSRRQPAPVVRIPSKGRGIPANLRQAKGPPAACPLLRIGRKSFQVFVGSRLSLAAQAIVRAMMPHSSRAFPVVAILLLAACAQVPRKPTPAPPVAQAAPAAAAGEAAAPKGESELLMAGEMALRARRVPRPPARTTRPPRRCRRKSRVASRATQIALGCNQLDDRAGGRGALA